MFFEVTFSLDKVRLCLKSRGESYYARVTVYYYLDDLSPANQLNLTAESRVSEWNPKADFEHLFYYGNHECM